MSYHNHILSLSSAPLTVDAVANKSLWLAPPDWSVQEALDYLDDMGWDTAPVAGMNRFIERSLLSGRTGTVQEASRELTDKDLIEADRPLLEGIERLKEQQSLFIRKEGRLTGIITRADLQHPLVSLMAFGIVLSVETALKRLIPTLTHNRWLEQLPEGRREKIKAVAEARRKQRADLTDLDGCAWSDLVTIASRCNGIQHLLGCTSNGKTEDALNQFDPLRNVLAHSGSILDAQPDPIAAIELLMKLVQTSALFWKCIEHGDYIWPAFLQTEIKTAEGELWTGPNATPLPANILHVVTAWNPGVVFLHESRNRRRQERLEKRLSQPFWRVIGYSAAGSWREESVAIPETSREKAVELGRLYGQRAIFELTHELVRVIDCSTGQERCSRSRMSQYKSPADS